MLSTTAFLALAVQCAPSVHPDTAYEVARVESGFNPYAIAEIIPKAERSPGDSGVISHFPQTKEAALQIVDNIKLKKRRYSVGLMQITSTNFSKFDVNAAKLFSPCTNLSVFEKIMADCFNRGGTVENALSCYYSGDFNTGKLSEPSFGNTSYTQRIGFKPQYTVPSVKEAISVSKESKLQTSKRELIVYPQYAMRGTVSEEKEINDVETE